MGIIEIQQTASTSCESQESTKMSILRQRKRYFIISTILMLALVMATAIVTAFVVSKSEESDYTDCSFCTSNEDARSELGQLCTKSDLGNYKEYAVSTDSDVCAPTGRKILEKGGNAADAIISVLLCMGVTIPESLGLGGGGLFVVYNASTKNAAFINARETAPAAAHAQMYNKTNQSGPKDSSVGLRAIATPGDLAGYWHLFKNHGSGKVTWEELFEDPIKFARDGFPVGDHFEDCLAKTHDDIMNHKAMRDVYVNPATGKLYLKKENFKQTKLAETLTNLSKAQNPREYYYGHIADLIMNDLNNNQDYLNQKPVITKSDFTNYQVRVEEPHKAQLKDGITIYTSQLPGSGPLLTFMLRTMLTYTELYPEAKRDPEKAQLFYHRLMETFKFAYSRRMHLGDDEFDDVKAILANLTSQQYIDYIAHKIEDKQTHTSVSGFYDLDGFNKQKDHGTAHVSVLDKDGNAVSATSTVNLYFGSRVMSPSTGILLNDQMDDFNANKTNEFGIPASYKNFIAPLKRPLSSMTPAIFVDDSGVRLVVGASGGPKITTAVALTALRQLYMGDNIKLAIDAPRLHHQLFPTNVEHEECFPKSILESLRQRKHEVKQLEKGVRGAVVMAISRDRLGNIQANSDFRKGGTVDGL